MAAASARGRRALLAVRLSSEGMRLCPLLCVGIGASHNFIKLFVLETEPASARGPVCGPFITVAGEHVPRGAAEPIPARDGHFQRRLPRPPGPPPAGPGFCEEEKINYYFNNEAKLAENPLRRWRVMSRPAGM